MTTRSLRRCGRALAAGALTLVLVAGGSLAASTEAEASPARRDASTGWMADVSPSQVSAVATSNGNTTVFVLGTDGAIWYRTDIAGTWTAWTAIPGGNGANAGPSAVAVEDSFVYVVARGRDGGVYLQSAILGPSGPAWNTWSPMWGTLGGNLTTAPAIATAGDGTLSVVGRGGDGAIWQRTSDRSFGWSTWVSLGGAAFSAPAIEADFDGSSWTYVVSVVGTDWRVWRRSARVDPRSPGAAGAWGGGQLYSSHGPGGINTSADWYTPDRTLAVGGPDHSVVLVDPDSAWYAALGGWLTSTAGIVSLSDGTYRVFARGGDNQLWFNDFDPVAETATGWTALGGQLA